MLALILAVTITSCPVCVYEWPGTLGLSVFYEHEGKEGTAYTYREVEWVGAGCYDFVAEGHPVGALWSTGKTCGHAPALIFRDKFETGTTERWSSTIGE